MNRREFLETLLEKMISNQLVNVKSTAEWENELDSIDLVKQMLDETFHFENDMKDVRVFVGTISSIKSEITKTDNPHSYISEIGFSIKNTALHYGGAKDKRLFKINHDLGIKWFVENSDISYEVERHNRHFSEKDTTLKVYVDESNCIQAIEWLEK